jgi:hypothetical protein
MRPGQRNPGPIRHHKVTNYFQAGRRCIQATISVFSQRLDVCRVENGPVNFQTMRYTLIVNLVAAAVLGAVLWVALPDAIGRPLGFWAAFVVAAAALALLEWWRGRRLRREREQTESLRDSALW